MEGRWARGSRPGSQYLPGRRAPRPAYLAPISPMDFQTVGHATFVPNSKNCGVSYKLLI